MLPPIDNIGKDFLRAVFAEEKQLIPLSEVKWVNVPKWPEVCVKDLYQHYAQDPEMNVYFPSSFSKGRQIDRAFFFNVLNTIRPNHC